MSHAACLRRLLACCVLAGGLVVLPGGFALAAGPASIVNELHDALAAVSRAGKHVSFRERYERIRAAIERTFDLPQMARTASGDAWWKADEKTRGALVDAYARITAMTYAEQLDGYDDLNFVVTSTHDGPDGTRRVVSRAEAGGGSLPLTYVMTRQGSGDDWLIADVLLYNAISEITTRRSEYRALLDSGGVPKLVSALNDKADQLLRP